MPISSPEGAMPQSQGQPGSQGQDPSQGGAADGLAKGLKALGDSTQALVQGLTQSGAPKEIIQLAQTAADALSQLQQAVSGSPAGQSAAPQGQDQSGSAQEQTNA